jgi:hypothetical protein
LRTPTDTGAGNRERGDATAQAPYQQLPNRRPLSRSLQAGALAASMIVAAAATVTLLFGIWNYNQNSNAQVQALALGSLQHYLDFAVEHPDLASRQEEQRVDARYAWFAAEAINTAQTLWRLVGAQPDWQRTIRAIIRQHGSYLRSGAFVCDDFTPGFIDYLREKVPQLKCAELANSR